MFKKLLLIASIGTFCGWLVLRNIDSAEVWKAVSGVSLLSIVASMLLLGIAFIFRSYRWQLFARKIKIISLHDLFALHSVSFLAILLFPFRLGELARPFLLKTHHQIPVSASLVMLVVERVFDAIVASTILLIGIYGVTENREVLAWQGMNFDMFLRTITYLLGGGIVCLILFIVLNRKAFRYLEIVTQYLPLRMQTTCKRIFPNIQQALQALPDLRSFSFILLTSLGVWLPTVVGSYLLIEGFHFALPWTAAFCVVGLSNLGMALPGPPAGIGIFQFFVLTSLALYGIPKSEGLAFALVMHLINIVYVLAVGVLYLHRMRISLGSLYTGLRKKHSF